MGTHLGEVQVEGERLFGTGVNVATRLEGLAEPGGVRTTWTGSLRRSSDRLTTARSALQTTAVYDTLRRSRCGRTSVGARLPRS